MKDFIIPKHIASWLRFFLLDPSHQPERLRCLDVELSDHLLASIGSLVRIQDRRRVFAIRSAVQNGCILFS
jgi:hypothetical protein